ncbi:MAG: hypothetical protein HUJ26_21035 [Planctomycetaceae bacterium]|nr:hypothetical protein [Planctomycetaceae bacterium]
MPVGDAGNIHLEYFGIFTEAPTGDSDKHYLSPGYHIEVYEVVELGVRVGWGLNDQSANFFSYVGIGILF